MVSSKKREDTMNPQTFARAVVSIESKYGLRIDAAEAWARMDGITCGKGWKGSKPGCKRSTSRNQAKHGLGSGAASTGDRKTAKVAGIEQGRKAIGSDILARLDSAIAPEKRIETEEIKKLRLAFDKVFDDDPVGSWDSPESKALTVAEIKAYGIRQTALSVMEELRAELLQISAKSAKGIAANVRVLKSASKHDTEIRDHLSEFIQLTGGKSAETFKGIKIDSSRAYVDTDSGMVNMGRGDSFDARKKVLFHELGHLVEVNSRLDKETVKWLDQRVTGPAKPLNTMSKLAEYDDDEVARPDHFVDPYVGKEYPGGFTEVLSMGLERMVSTKAMLSFYQADKQHFLLTVGLTRR